MEGITTVVKRGGVNGVLGEPITDGDNGDTALERLGEEPFVDAFFVAIHKTATVNVEQEGMRTGAGCAVEIHDIALVWAVGNVGAVWFEFV